MNVIMYSVEMKSTYWSDDLFVGSLDDCFEYCEKMGYVVDGEECRIAEILADGNSGCIFSVLGYIFE